VGKIPESDKVTEEDISLEGGANEGVLLIVV